MQILPASIPADLPAFAQLFRAYAAELPIDLGYQGFDNELASLPGAYAPPHGALLIARDETKLRRTLSLLWEGEGRVRVERKRLTKRAQSAHS